MSIKSIILNIIASFGNVLSAFLLCMPGIIVLEKWITDNNLPLSNTTGTHTTDLFSWDRMGWLAFVLIGICLVILVLLLINVFKRNIVASAFCIVLSIILMCLLVFSFFLRLRGYLIPESTGEVFENAFGPGQTGYGLQKWYYGSLYYNYLLIAFITSIITIVAAAKTKAKKSG